MLHMAIARHTADRCALASPSARKQALSVIGKMDEVAGAHRCSVVGAWGNLVAHTTFFLIESSDAHTVEEMLVDLGVVGLNTVDIYPVRPQSEVFELLRKLATADDGA